MNRTGARMPTALLPKVALRPQNWMLGFALCALLYAASRYSFLLFHTIAESFSILIAVSLFIVAWNTRRLTQNFYLLFIGIAYLFAGLIDFVHTLAYRGMGIFPGYDANLPTQLWIAARYLQGLSLLAAPWFIDHRPRVGIVFVVYLLVTALLLAALFRGGLFPDCFVEGAGLTPFKIASEYVICAILIVSLFLLLRRRDAFDPEILRLLAWSILLTILAEFTFTFYVSVYGLSNLVGHVFKIFAFYLVYDAIIATGLKDPFRLLFRDLQQKREELQTILDAAPVMIFYKNAENRFIRVNRALARATGLPKEAIEGRSAFELYPRQAESVWADDRRVIASGEPLLAIVEPMDTPSGTRWVQTEKIPFRNADGRIAGVIGFSLDITDRKRIEESLRASEQRYRELSMIDDLTKLYNSRHFQVQIKSETERANRYGQPLALLLLDIDDFKAYNDAYGHVEGDLVLSRLGLVVKRCLRETDSAYRYGGEEFTVLLPMTTAVEALVTAERIRAAFGRERFQPAPGLQVSLTVSIGLAQYRPPEETKAFVHRADQRMYDGKKGGKNRVCGEA